MGAPQHIKNSVQVVDELFVHDPISGSPITGLIDGNWTKVLYNPSGVEVSGSVTVTVTELGSTGIYRVTWTPNVLGSWALRLTYATLVPQQWFGAEYECYSVAPGELTTTTASDLVDDVWDEQLTAHAIVGSSGLALSNLNKIESGRWIISNNQMIIYDSDGLTPLFTFNLRDSFGNPSMADVFERVPVP